jgi:hypothetical protein
MRYYGYAYAALVAFLLHLFDALKLLKFLLFNLLVLHRTLPIVSFQGSAKR